MGLIYPGDVTQPHPEGPEWFGDLCGPGLIYGWQRWHEVLQSIQNKQALNS